MIVIEMAAVLRTNELKYFSEISPQEQEYPRVLTVFNKHKNRPPSVIEVIATNRYGLGRRTLFFPQNEEVYTSEIQKNTFAMFLYPTSRVYNGEFSVIKTGSLYEILYPKVISVKAKENLKFTEFSFYKE